MPLIWGTSRQIPSFLETLNPAPGSGSLIRRQIGRSCRNWPKTTSGRGDGRWAGVYSRCGDNWGDWGGHCGLWWTIASVDCGGHCCRQCGGHCGLWWTHFGHFCLDRRSSRQVWWGRLGILSIGNLQNDASEIYAEGSDQAEKFIYFPIWIEIFGTMNQIAERNFQTRKQKYPRIAAKLIQPTFAVIYVVLSVSWNAFAVIYFKLSDSANKGRETCWAGDSDFAQIEDIKWELMGQDSEWHSTELRSHQIRSPCWCWDSHLRGEQGRWRAIIILFLTLLSTTWLPTKLGALKIYSFIHRPLIIYCPGDNIEWEHPKICKKNCWPKSKQTQPASICGTIMTINVANPHILPIRKWSHSTNQYTLDNV